jgi:perosamine synthetase
LKSPELKYDLQIKFGSEYGAEEEQAVLEVLRQGAPTSGVACQRFEQEFAAYCGTRQARAVTNGTASLFLSLLAVGVGKGDRVITTPFTWIATAAAAATLGAEVDFADIDPHTCNLDPEQLAARITPNTRAVIPVHLYGQCCDMDPILSLADKHGFHVIEDACHALGARYKGRMAGSMGAAGCFSFH